MDKLSLVEGFLIALGCSWVGWSSITTIVLLIKDASTKKDMKSLLTRLESVYTELKNDFSKMEGSVEEHINRINQRFDMFLKTEIDLLKDIASKKSGRVGL